MQSSRGYTDSKQRNYVYTLQIHVPRQQPERVFTLANIITPVGIGAVINIASSLALSDPQIVQGPASIFAIEARHDAFFRYYLISDIPNRAPFDTRISGTYALNLASPFIVKDSRAAPSFPAILTSKAGATGKMTRSSGQINIYLDTANVSKEDLSKPLYVAWLTQANVVPYQPTTVDRAGVIKSMVPEGMAGMAFAALTWQETAEDVNSLTAVTFAGPAPVQAS